MTNLSKLASGREQGEHVISAAFLEHVVMGFGKLLHGEKVVTPVRSLNKPIVHVGDVKVGSLPPVISPSSPPIRALMLDPMFFVRQGF